MNSPIVTKPIARNRNQWIILALLLVLCVVPVAGGIVRMTQLLGGGEVTPANARFFAAPIPVLLHILAIIPYSILGAFQFIPRFRRRNPKWHRVVGRILIPSGLVVALTGLWMSFFYPWPAGDGEVLFVMRLVVGALMIYSILRGVAAIQQRNFAQHGAWMLRGYALAMGAGTQVFTHLPWFLLVGGIVFPDELSRAVMMGAGWVINLLIAEWIIRRRSLRPARTKSAMRSQVELA